MNKKVIITGVTGQFGSYMVDYLLKNTDHEIYGMVRRLSVQNHKNIEHNKNNPRFHLFSGDLTDEHSIQEAIQTIQPDYFINAAAQSFVSESWISPVNTFNTDCIAVIHILEAIRKFRPSCRFLNMGSSEEFGDVVHSPQNIDHPFRARSPYGAAKVAAHQIVKVYRESYGLYALQCICFNYESERRGFEFVTRKITYGAARIYHAIKNNQDFEPITLGNLESERDWSHAEDFVDGTWKMINQEEYTNEPWDLFVNELEQTKYYSKKIKEYIFSSGKTNTVRKFIELAFKEAGINGCWINGEPLILDNKTYLDVFALKQKNGAYPILVQTNPKFNRPADVEFLCGNSEPARKELGWEPKVNFEELVKRMVKYDIENYGK